MMKHVLCYGDSNTWGYIPMGKHSRYSDKIRYPMVLQAMLGDEYKVYEDGLCGRCICNNYQNSDDSYNGAIDFPRKLSSYENLDYIVLFLGSNDMKDEFKTTSLEAAIALENIYINRIYTYFPNATIIIVAPCVINKPNFEGFINAYKKSENFDTDYKIIADKYNCKFVSNKGFELGEDKLHFTNNDHYLLAKRLAPLIQRG